MPGPNPFDQFDNLPPPPQPGGLQLGIGGGQQGVGTLGPGPVIAGAPTPNLDESLAFSRAVAAARLGKNNSAGPNPFDQFDTKPVVQAAIPGQQLASDALSTGGQVLSGAVRGLAGIPGIPADMFGLGMRGAQYLAGQGDKPPLQNPFEAFGSNTFRTMAERNLPLAPQSQEGAAPYAESIGEFAGGALPFGGLGALRQGGATAAREVASIGAGGAGAEYARQAYPNSTIAQIAIPLATGSAPAGYRAIGQAIRGGLRGNAGQAGQMRQNLEAFDRVSQTAGQPIQVNPGQVAGEHNMMQVGDALLARSPGGQPGVMNANVSQQRGAAQAVANTARRPNAALPIQRQPNPTTAGDALARGFDNFVNGPITSQVGPGVLDPILARGGFMAKAGMVEQRLEQRIGNATRFPTTNTTRALRELDSRAANDPAIQALVRTPYVQRVRDALTHGMIANPAGQMVGAGALSFGAMRELRSAIGELSGKAPLLEGVRKGQLDHLYAGLSEDMGNAAQAAGVGREWRRYNSWYSSGRTRIDDTLQRSMQGRESTPETIFNAVMNMDRSQAFQAMRSLNPGQRATVAGQALRELGQTTAAGAVAEGADYSYSTFIKNLTDMRQRGTLDAIFGSPELRPVRALLQDLETASESALRANKVAHDVSGATMLRGTAAGGVVMAAVTGHPLVAAGLFALAFPAPAITGRLLRSQAFLNWLAQTKSISPSELDRHLARLAVIGEQDPKLREGIAQYAAKVRELVRQGK